MYYSIIGVLQFNRFGMPHVGAGSYIFAKRKLSNNIWVMPVWFVGQIFAGSLMILTRNCAPDGKSWEHSIPSQETTTVLGALTKILERGAKLWEIWPGRQWTSDTDFCHTCIHFSSRFVLLDHDSSIDFNFNFNKNAYFVKHQTEGTTVARAFWDEYPTDTVAWNIDRQFLWGSGLMISPVLDPGAVTVEAYFPDARWYDITYWTRTDQITEMKTRAGFETLGNGRKDRKLIFSASIFNSYILLDVFYSLFCPDAPLDIIPLHLHGGEVFPLQLEGITTTESRTNPWHFVVTLDDNDEANGELFMDDGVSQDTVENGQYYYVRHHHMIE